MELLSVIVPVYNCENYVDECIKSILAQNYTKIEIILVDDGSSDRSGVICDEYVKNHENISVIHQKNIGIKKARLHGVQQSKGTLITFVDADDWIHRDYYKDMLENMEDCDLVISGINRYVNEERCIKEKPYYKEGIYNKETIIEKIIPNMMWSPDINTWALDPSLCTKIFRKEIILKELEKGQEIRSDYGEDSMVVYPLLFNVNKMRIVKQAYYFHRQRAVGGVPPYIQDEEFFDKLHSVYKYLKKEFCQAGYFDIMRNQLEHFYYHSVELKTKGYNEFIYRFCCLFPFLDVEKDSRVILYGAGLVGKNYIEQNEKYRFCNIIFWVDKNYKNIQSKNNKIENPQIIKETTFDYIVIAINDYYTALQIAEYLYEMGVPQSKIVWHNIRKCANRLLQTN